MKGKVILDYVQTMQSAPTSRIWDGLCNGRKVITKNRLIMEKPYYSKENIFIIDVDRDEDLYDFIHLPFKAISEEKICESRFDSWKERFLRVKNKEGEMKHTEFIG